MAEEKRFNIRVYGILINDRNQILLSDETYKGRRFTKFPGGGLCYGEGIIAALEREFIEEANLFIQVAQLLYVTEGYVPSAFDQSQVVGIYYAVTARHEIDLRFKELLVDTSKGQTFRWVDLQTFSESQLTFPMDQEAWRVIQKSKYC